MVAIDAERLLDSLRTLRTFGSVGSGVVRPTFSDADMAARRWLRDQMAAAGLEASIDQVANVFGRSRRDGPAVVLGSHSDTQPTGGWLDGAFGVMCAIEVARSVADDPATCDLAVDAVAFSDEEGTYSSFLGSRSFVGEDLTARFGDSNAEGETVAEAIERVGLAAAPRVAFEPDRHIGYLEAHIEQGPRLEEGGHRIGIVSSIVGVRAMQVTCTGEQNHAGTTPMSRRKDAGVALFEFGTRLQPRLAELAGPASVWTIGTAGFDPGAESIVPGRAWCALQFRDPSEAVLDGFEAAIQELAAEMSNEGPVHVAAERRRDPMRPVAMSGDLRRHLAAAAERHAPGAWIDLPSAAAHDAMVIVDHLPAAMLFIPSIGGISHDFAEDSSDIDIVTGCQVLADAAVSTLTA